MKNNGNTATVEKTPQPASVTHAERIRDGRAYVPAVDIYENQNEILVIADVPGTTSDNIDVNFENGLLTIHARVEERQQGEQHRMTLREYGVGDFHRRFEIGEGIDAQRIEAEVRNGVLTLHLPKTEAVKPKKIAVKAV